MAKKRHRTRGGKRNIPPANSIAPWGREGEQPLGVVERDVTLASGATIRAGSPVSAVSAPVAMQAQLERALDDEHPGMGDLLREGMTPDQLAEHAPTIARAASRAGLDTGQYSFSSPPAQAGIPAAFRRNSGMPASGHVLPKGRTRGREGSGQRVHGPAVPKARRSSAPANYVSGGGRRGGQPPRNPPLPGPVHSEPGGASPTTVMETWAALTEACRHPAEPVRSFFNQYAGRAEQAIREAPDEQLAQAWGYMFVGFTSGDAMLALLGRQLAPAQCFQVTGEMVGATADLFERVKGARGTADVWIEEGDLPVIDGERKIAGFAWLDEPLTLVDPDGTRIMYRALSWCRQEAEFNAVDGRQYWSGVRITSWIHYGDEDSFFSPENYAGLAPHIPLLVAHTIFVPFGQRFALRQPDAQATPDDVAWWLRTLWLFMAGHVVVPGHVERHARKRIARQVGRPIEQGAIRVVTLRKASTAEPGEGSDVPGKVNWTCRWTVDPFTRHRVDPRRRDYKWHQAVAGPDGLCIICGGETSHVGSFTKGPSWAPFRVRKKMYRVAR